MSQYLRDLLRDLGLGNPLHTLISTLMRQGMSDAEITERVRDATRDRNTPPGYSIHPITGDILPDNHPDFQPDNDYDDGYDS